MEPLDYRAIFISDIHLGTADCRADYLLDFLRHTRCDTLYLVGDVVDLWAMRRQVHWPQSHSEVVRTFFELAASGTRVVYIPGNHDEALRALSGCHFNGIEILRDTVHVTRDGLGLRVSHGDEFDAAVRCGRLVQAIGDVAYNVLLWLNRHTARLRGRYGRPYWSLSAWLKERVGGARRYVRRFMLAAVHEARQGDFDGYVCGHIHVAGIEQVDGMLYCNDGDWVEHCTALVENRDGRLQLIHWADHKRVEREHTGDEVLDAVSPLPVPELVAQWARQLSR
ncbi:UDP-2,3-diacylglucosamine hydrolase [Acidihalobacter yilgarnensis]|uniref:UDP-2,3-diacylglucosamine hydrolase n=1 Tax=Acidihalobacter yilgarnensis TaxID=2819280 RepID=A0A1D8IL19_9GAMM|nr:UDP-2,3-diacylglucosamine diphosphatase [Acidihalobacter yilgarnensis]AOU97157.1 UDP-2,3-diacylglucosamine hydrolase [Acidihalobacter yilgarnensis]